MSEGMDALKNRLTGAEAFDALLTGPRDIPEDGVIRVDARMVLNKGERYVQLNRRTETQSFHENLKRREGVDRLMNMLPGFRQGVFTLPDMRIHALTNRRGEVSLRESRGVYAVTVNGHDRKKTRVVGGSGWQEALGLITAGGGVRAGMGDKLRQMDRFGRIVAGALPQIAGPFEVLDLCCGKGYLTFAVAQLLKDMGHDGVRITGMDLKADVIKRLNAAASEAGLERLRFVEGDIADCAQPTLQPAVLALHACDTATDIALAKAIGWNAPLILCAPCCQHELYGQVDSAVLKPMLKHGLFKERYAALLTDALRCSLLEQHGYRVDVLEFVDPEHTPKNTLIRAVYTGKAQPGDEYAALRDAMGVTPSLEKLLNKR